MRGRIISNKKIINRHFLLTLKLPGSFQTPMPGQFIMVREKERLDPLLGRPFSIYSFERINNAVIVEILYKVIGKGTSIMSMAGGGGLLEIFGPYGRAFDLFPYLKKIVLICGGIGIAPLTFLASHYKRLTDAGDVELICYLGGTGIERLVGIEKIKELCSGVFISTDNGSMGYHGFVTEMFAHDISSYDREKTMIYACGPRPMLMTLSEMLTINPLPCQVSLEERMACGVGACLGCTIEVKHREGKGVYTRVCKDGPVFNIQDIAWG